MSETKPVSERELAELCKVAKLAAIGLAQYDPVEYHNRVLGLIHSYRELRAAGQALRRRYPCGCAQECGPLLARWDALTGGGDEK